MKAALDGRLTTGQTLFMQPGDEWVYRLRDEAPSERVRIIETTMNRHHGRATIEHLDGKNAGRIEVVPGTRLRAPWSEVARYDEKMSAWARLDSEPMTEVETYATEVVIELLVPKSVATSEWAPVRHAMAVHDVKQLTQLMKVSIDLILADAQSFDDGGTLSLSPLGATLVCAALCKAHPAAILEHVLADEASQRELCITGFTGRIIKGKGIYVDTECLAVLSGPLATDPRAPSSVVRPSGC